MSQTHIRYIFINPELGNHGGISTIAQHLEEHDPRSIILNLSSIQDNHSVEIIADKILDIVYKKKDCELLLIPNAGDLSFTACSIAKHRAYQEKKINIGIIGGALNHQANTFEQQIKFNPCISAFQCPSPSIQKKLVTVIPEREEDIFLCPPVFNKRLKTVSPKKNPGTLKIVFCARLSIHEKGINLLIEIQKKLEAQKLNYHLTIIGKGPSEENLKEELRSENVTLKGFIPNKEIHRELIKHDCFLQLSPSEGFGIACFEAMSCSLVPIIRKTKTGIELYLKDNHDCIILGSTANNFVHAIKKLLTNQDLLNKLKRESLITSKNLSLQFDYINNINIVINYCLRNKRSSTKHPIDPTGELIKIKLSRLPKNNKNKITVYGLGHYGKRLIDECIKKNITVSKILETHPTQKTYKNISVEKPNNKNIQDCELILIGSEFFKDEITKKIRETSTTPVL